MKVICYYAVIGWKHCVYANTKVVYTSSASRQMTIEYFYAKCEVNEITTVLGIKSLYDTSPELIQPLKLLPYSYYFHS